MRLPTGIDRVELAYLRQFLHHEGPVFGLVATAIGFAVLDRAGMQALLARYDGAVAWGSADRLSRLRGGADPRRQRAESDIRRLAVGRALPIGLPKLLARHVPRGAIYFNTGHTNLEDRVLGAVKSALAGRVAVMIHDTIPLDYPQFQRAGVPERFGRMLARVIGRADWIICNSAATADSIRRHAAPSRPLPELIVAHLGVELPHPAATWPRPGGFDPARPHFVAVGTIEPRKNHAFLLSVWDALLCEGGPDPVPQLVILGARGWNNAALFARLDSDPLMGRHVFECPGLGDAELAAAMRDSAGLLQPSHAEGYGLPPIEAAALGVTVLCNDLAVYREVLGDYPVYRGIDTLYPWVETITALSQAPGQARAKTPLRPPGWPAYFRTVLSIVH